MTIGALNRAPFSFGSVDWRAALAWTAEGGCPHVVIENGGALLRWADEDICPYARPKPPHKLKTC